MKRFLIIFIVLNMLQFTVVFQTSADEGAKDCFEKINRATFAFNMGLDKAIIKPVSKGYRKLPSPIRTGTSNALNNLSNLITVPNNILQGDFISALHNTTRFLINSTLGIIGIFDPANSFGLERKEKEDFGQTLGVMGVGEGCYIVLPVLGPSTIRDTVGSMISFSGGDAWYNITVKNDTQYFNESDYYYSKGLTGVDFRAKNLEAFESVEKNSVDLYATVRSIYLQDRKKKINNSKEFIETMDDSDWDSIEK